MDTSNLGSASSLLGQLDRWPIVHTLVRVTRVRYAIRWLLSRFPIRRTLESGVTYRIRTLDGLSAADEIFNRGVYDRAVRDSELRTFIDLGCNIGLFPCMLTHRTGRKDLEGIVIDANEVTLEEARWHLEQNGLKGVRSVLGLVGAADSTDGTSDFYICPSDLGSSQFLTPEPGRPSKGKWEKRRVPTITVEEVWTRHFGEKRVNLLKVDIEGSEELFLKAEAEFLQRVDAIVLEVHLWLVDAEQVGRTLSSAGFSPPEVLVKEGLTEVLYYRRPRTRA